MAQESEWQLEMMRPFESDSEQIYLPTDELKRKMSRSSSSSCSRVISFGITGKPKEDVLSGIAQISPTDHNKSTSAPANREHVVAERQRREKLTQRFVLLSSLLPALKKLDKASVLGEAARYVKQLQEQVKTLEEQGSKRTEDSETKNSSSSSDDGNSFSDPFPEIETRISNKDVLIKIHCQTRQGVVAKVLDEIQNLHLNLISSNAMQFGKSAMDITIVAQMTHDFSITDEYLVMKLRQSLQDFFLIVD